MSKQIIITENWKVEPEQMEHLKRDVAFFRSRNPQNSLRIEISRRTEAVLKYTNREVVAYRIPGGKAEFMGLPIVINDSLDTGEYHILKVLT